MGLSELIKDYVERTVEYKIYSHEPDEDGYMSDCSTEQKAMEYAFIKLKIYTEKYEQKMLMDEIPDEFLSKIRDLPFVKSIEFGEFEGCANVLVRLSEMNIDTEKKIHEMEYDLAQNFGGYISILVLPVLEE
jgi:hypothetical protein